MIEVTASYLSGAEPDAVSPADGRLRAGDEGIAFAGTSLPDSSLSGRKVAFAVAIDELRGASLGAPDDLRRLASGALGYFWLGPLGGIIGMGSSRRGLLVAVERDERSSVLAFAVPPDDGVSLLAHLQQARARAGLGALPSIEVLAGPPPDHRLLVEIRDLLAAQGDVLARIAAALERRPGA